MNIEILKEVIDEAINGLLKHGIHIPNENLRNHYLKACFLLSRYQRLAQYTLDDKILRNVKFLKENFKLLR